MKANGIFMTGTDTGVGKTVVSAALLSVFRGSGIDAVPMKPVQTGCARRNGKLTAPDLEFMLAVAGLAPSKEERELMCPYRFEPACSPHLAARKAGVAISLERIADCFRKLAARHEIVIVEGAGGILVPIRGRTLIIDLISALKLPAILVGRAGLGTINHTLLSLRELKRAKVNVLGVVTNKSERGGNRYIEDDNRRTIERLGGVKVLARLDYVPKVALDRDQNGGRSSATPNTWARITRPSTKTSSSRMCHASTERCKMGRDSDTLGRTLRKGMPTADTIIRKINAL